jgi:hypothetical protein
MHSAAAAGQPNVLLWAARVAVAGPLLCITLVAVLHVLESEVNDSDAVSEYALGALSEGTPRPSGGGPRIPAQGTSPMKSRLCHSRNPARLLGTFLERTIIGVMSSREMNRRVAIEARISSPVSLPCRNARLPEGVGHGGHERSNVPDRDRGACGRCRRVSDRHGLTRPREIFAAP